MTLGDDAGVDVLAQAVFEAPPIRSPGIGIDTVVMGPRLPYSDRQNLTNQTLLQPISTKRRKIRAGDKVFHCGWIKYFNTEKRVSK